MSAPTPPVDVALGAVTLRLRCDALAEYRLSGIGRKFDFTDWKKTARKFAFICDWTWACAIECPFETPGELALAIGAAEKTDKQIIGRLSTALWQAIDTSLGLATGPAADEKKNGANAGLSTVSPSG